MTRVRELYWRPDRIEHISLHAVTPEEVDEAVFGDRAGLLVRVGPAERNPDEMVYRYFGRTEAGRHLMIALLYMGRGIAMPLTARDLTPRERSKFNERRIKGR